MPEFFNVLPPGEALRVLLDRLEPQIEAEIVAAYEALGRVTAAEVLSAADLPAFPRSTMDGYSVRSADTFGATESLPAFLDVVGDVPMGAEPSVTLAVGQAARAYTGGNARRRRRRRRDGRAYPGHRRPHYRGDQAGRAGRERQPGGRGHPRRRRGPARRPRGEAAGRRRTHDAWHRPGLGREAAQGRRRVDRRRAGAAGVHARPLARCATSIHTPSPRSDREGREACR